MKALSAIVALMLIFVVTAADELSLARDRVEAVQNGRLTFEFG